MICLIEHKYLDLPCGQLLIGNPLAEGPRSADHHLVCNWRHSRDRHIILLSWRDRTGTCNASKLAHPCKNRLILLRKLPSGANADGLGDLEVRVDAAKHAEDEAGGLAGAVVRLRDEVLVGRREDHWEGDRLDLTRAAEPHLIVEPLEQLRR
uniref:Uncharacterized protein n=1 Tax=Arundo donax TaxID=35708 RepID=A0A0A9D7J3_ARUDO